MDHHILSSFNDATFGKAVREAGFDPDTIKRNVGRMKEEKAQIKSALARLDKSSDRFLDDGLMILELVQDLPRAWREASDDQRHRMLKLVFDRVVVTNERFDFHVREPFRSLYAMGLGKGSEWLLGQDSNLQPSGYKRPRVSSGLGLSLHPSRDKG